MASEAPVDVDVAIIGAGGAGLSAAVSATDRGARVMVFEAADQIGGSTALAGGSFMAAGTPTQRELGYLDDTPDDLFRYYVTLNQWKVDAGVIRRFCDEGPPTMEWLKELGVRFPASGLYRAGLEPAPRSHRAEGRGAAIVEALGRACAERDIDIALSNRVDGLMVDDTGVVGLRARGEELRAHAVVLTSGGFANNRELLERHYPDALLGGVELRTPCPPTNQGDGLRMATEVGAATSGFNHGETGLVAAFTGGIQMGMPPWLVFVNRSGTRFIAEDAPYFAMPLVFREQGDVAWAIFDEQTRASARPDHTALFPVAGWDADALADAVTRGDLTVGESLLDLAAKIDVPAAALEATMEQYNRSCAAGVDREFVKDPKGLLPVATAPFYAVPIRHGNPVVTAFGPRIDPDARVLSTDNRPIPGLFAAGEVTGNVFSEVYVGGGNSIGNAVIFGRVAGLTAADDALRASALARS